VKKLLCIAFFLLNVIFCKSQVASNIDSVSHELDNAKEDTSRVLLLNQLAVAYARFEWDTAYWYAQRAYKLADKINYKKGEYLSGASLAWCWWSVGE